MPKFPNNPRVLKAKLASYETFSGIAHAIQLVAFAKLKKLKKKIDSRFVSLKFVKTLLKNYYSIESNNSYKHCLVIPFTVDKSCCGAVNNPILKYTIKFINKLKSGGIIVSIAPVGKKGYNLLRRKYRYEIAYHLHDLELDMNLLTTSYFFLEQLRTKKYNQGYLIFAQFINNFMQHLVYCNFPSYGNFVSSILRDQRESNLVLDVFLEKNIDDKSFVRDAYSFFMSLLILDSFEETEYSQLGAKAKTMELAIQNVTDTITILRIKYNKSRQAIITNEIIEILNATVAILE
jgi:F-type H+-transporting ATPase subunit gamma